ncbi:MAG: LamB/YcsF family protein, partial [Pseudomonadota bacterium]
ATMAEAISLAQRHNVSVGAHPSYPDREGFGRRSKFCSADELYGPLTEQMRAILLSAESQGARVTHVKPHGALYNDAASDPDLAREIVLSVAAVLPDAALVGLPSSSLSDAAAEAGFAFVSEGFVDRRYQPDGTLVPRTEENALIEQISNRAEQAVLLAKGEPIDTGRGHLQLGVQTLCLHGDSAGAAETATSVRASLETAGVMVRSPYV